MHPQSIFAIRHWKLPEILFVAAACFAMAAVGFFLAVFLQLHFSPETRQTYANSQLVPIVAKSDVLQSVADSSPQAGADDSDARAREKARLLKSLGRE